MISDSDVRAFQNGWLWAEKEAMPVQIVALREFLGVDAQITDNHHRRSLFEDGVFTIQEGSNYYQKQMTDEEVENFVAGAFAYLDHLEDIDDEAA